MTAGYEVSTETLSGVKQHNKLTIEKLEQIWRRMVAGNEIDELITATRSAGNILNYILEAITSIAKN